MNLKSKALLAVLVIGLLFLAEKKFSFSSENQSSSQMEHEENEEYLIRTPKPIEANPSSNTARPTQGNSSNTQDYQMGRDGRLHETAPCGLCEGTGIERNHNRNSMNPEEGRICPQCGGSGHQSY